MTPAVEAIYPAGNRRAYWPRLIRLLGKFLMPAEEAMQGGVCRRDDPMAQGWHSSQPACLAGYQPADFRTIDRGDASSVTGSF